MDDWDGELKELLDGVELRRKMERKYGEERNVYRALAVWQRVAIWSLAATVVAAVLWLCWVAN